MANGLAIGWPWSGLIHHKVVPKYAWTHWVILDVHEEKWWNSYKPFLRNCVWWMDRQMDGYPRSISIFPSGRTGRVIIKECCWLTALLKDKTGSGGAYRGDWGQSLTLRMNSMSGSVLIIWLMKCSTPLHLQVNGDLECIPTHRLLLAWKGGIDQKSLVKAIILCIV